MLDTIDAKIGAQLRLWRCLKGIRRAELALAIGLTPAHLALVEDGRARLGAARLFAAAKTLGVPVATIIEGADHS
ncbi:helix-turn-helix domain-containing protein [Maricaulis sp. CAU 1757]